jgi:ABC-type lipoprotein release transport system permease subunit
VRLLVTLALRNLMRHKRRTFLTAAALVLGIAIMILGRAWSEATGEAVVEPAKLSTLGHVQIFAKDAAADEGGEVSFIAPQNNYRLIDGPHRVIETVLRDEPRLSAGLRRLMVGALLSSGDVSMEGLLIGIDARARASVYPALELREGRFFEPGEKGILVNRGVARKLGARPGDAVVALGTTADGRLAGVKLTVTGIWKVRGLDAYEWGSCFASLEAVQELLDAGDAAGVLVFRQRDEREAAAPIAASVNAALARAGIEARAYTWEEMGGPFIGGMIVTRFVGGILHLVLAIIAAAGVLNTALMSVFERTREIGTIRAIGWRRTKVVALFLIEGLLLGLLGAVGGGLLGAVLVSWFSRHGIPAFSEAQRYSYGGDYLYPALSWPDLLAIPGFMVVVSVLAALGPAVMAARLRPADALRHV